MRCFYRLNLSKLLLLVSLLFASYSILYSQSFELFPSDTLESEPNGSWNVYDIKVLSGTTDFLVYCQEPGSRFALFRYELSGDLVWSFLSSENHYVDSGGDLIVRDDTVFVYYTGIETTVGPTIKCTKISVETGAEISESTDSIIDPDLLYGGTPSFNIQKCWSQDNIDYVAARNIKLPVVQPACPDPEHFGIKSGVCHFDSDGLLDYNWAPRPRGFENMEFQNVLENGDLIYKTARFTDTIFCEQPEASPDKVFYLEKWSVDGTKLDSVEFDQYPTYDNSIALGNDGWFAQVSHYESPSIRTVIDVYNNTLELNASLEFNADEGDYHTWPILGYFPSSGLIAYWYLSLCPDQSYGEWPCGNIRIFDLELNELGHKAYHPDLNNMLNPYCYTYEIEELNEGSFVMAGKRFLSFEPGSTYSSTWAYVEDLYSIIEPTAIENEIVDQSLKVYPNPGSHSITIRNNDPASSGLFLHDIEGRLLQEYNISDESLILDLQNLPNGVYWIRTADGFAEKFVKQ